MGAKPNWTKEELDYLQDSWGRVSIPGIAKKLGRSINAVKLKAHRMDLGCHLEHSEYISLNQLVKALGKPHAYGYTTEMWERHGLPIRYVTSVRQRYKMIAIDDFWRWAETHKDLLDFSRFEKNMLGKEPEWVAEKRRADYHAARYKKTPWTKTEDDKLRHMLRQYRYTYADISQELCRTEGALKRRILDLGLMERPVKAERQVWSTEQAVELLDLKERGLSFEEIALQIGRTALACRGKYEALTIRPDYSREYHRKRRLLAYMTYLMKLRFNQMNFDGYWQKDMCMHWDDVDGCKAGEQNCDDCVSFRRIVLQYCRRCGKEFLERKTQAMCADCRTARKKQAQKKYAILQGGNERGNLQRPCANRL